MARRQRGRPAEGGGAGRAEASPRSRRGPGRGRSGRGLVAGRAGLGGPGALERGLGGGLPSLLHPPGALTPAQPPSVPLQCWCQDAQVAPCVWRRVQPSARGPLSRLWPPLRPALRPQHHLHPPGLPPWCHSRCRAACPCLGQAGWTLRPFFSWGYDDVIGHHACPSSSCRTKGLLRGKEAPRWPSAH